jgi:16S rRNA C967 or C1407 C5-methylase (RsmB/RsmF family)
VDTCAGRGGKTLCLTMVSGAPKNVGGTTTASRAMGGTRGTAAAALTKEPTPPALTVAFDIDARALSDMGVRLSRSGVRCSPLAGRHAP